MKNSKMIIGKRLKYLRKKQKVEVNYILDRVDIARSTYNGYEAGTREPNGDKLVKLAEVFNTTVDFLMGRTDEDLPMDQDTLQKFMQADEFVYKGQPLSKEDTEAIKKFANLINSTILDKYKDQ